MPVSKGEEFTIELERAPGVKFGWTVHFTKDSSGILVHEVLEGGLVEGWNQKNEDSALEPGDLIVQVNGSSGEDMKQHLGLAAAKETGPIKFLLKKGCPEDVPPPAAPRPKLLQLFSGFQLSGWAPLIVLTYRKNLEELDEAKKNLVVIVFFAIMVVRLATLGLEYLKIRDVTKEEIVEVPPVYWFGKEMKPPEEADAHAYEMGLWKDYAREVVLGGGMVFFLYQNYGTMMPMGMHLFRTTFKFFESPLFKVHVRGQKLMRPYGPKPLDWKGLAAAKEAKKED